MRYECDDGSYIEYSDHWSRAENRAAWQATDDGILDVLRPKIVAMHLLCGDGSYMDDPAQLTVEALDRIDMRIYLWFAATWVACLNDLANLGNAWRRRLFDTSGKTETTAA